MNETQATTRKQSIQGLDLLKFILSIMIIAAHTSLFEEYAQLSKIRETFTGFAVPSFFAMSSYFFYRKIVHTYTHEQTSSILKKSIIRLSILFIVWYVLMLPMTYIRFFSIATLKETIFAILFSCCVNGYGFIKALIINTVILYFCRREKALICLTIVATMINLYCSYNYIYKYNSLFLDIHPYYSFYYHTAYFCCGALFARYQEKIDFTKWSIKILIVMWTTLFLMTFFLKIEPIYRLLSFPLLFPIL